MKKDWQAKPFRRMVVLGESTVAGGGWLQRDAERWTDVLVDLLDACQQGKIDHINKGIGANAISPQSPGYGESAKPSALELVFSRHWRATAVVCPIRPTCAICQLNGTR